jgi:hypothetical protein
VRVADGGRMVAGNCGLVCLAKRSATWPSTKLLRVEGRGAEHGAWGDRECSHQPLLFFVHKPPLLACLTLMLQPHPFLSIPPIHSEEKHGHITLPQISTTKDGLVSEELCAAAAMTADALEARAVLCFTRRGYMAGFLSRCRPDAPIFAFTGGWWEGVGSLGACTAVFEQPGGHRDRRKQGAGGMGHRAYLRAAQVFTGPVTLVGRCGVDRALGLADRLACCGAPSSALLSRPALFLTSCPVLLRNPTCVL